MRVCVFGFVKLYFRLGLSISMYVMELYTVSQFVRVLDEPHHVSKQLLRELSPMTGRYPMS